MRICPACSREYDTTVTRCLDDGAGVVELDTATSQRAENLVGQVVDGRYRLERVVGRGGMGTVYACRHVVVGKAFAMKVLRPGIERSEEVLQRFIREAQAANAIRSRHICEMTDFGQMPGGAFYIVMELLEGSSLTRALRERQLGRTEMLDIFAQVAETLERAHAAGIIHRDLKPDNVVLVDDEGRPNFVKLVDFGIAKMMQSTASGLTETGVILGTPYYMSPEQARGDPLDPRTDIYSLGVMMYRAFTGRLPFIADTAMGVITRHLTEQPQLPSRVGDVDPATEQVILRCMEKRPEARFQTMTEVAASLRAAARLPWTNHAAVEASPLSLPTYVPDQAAPSGHAHAASHALHHGAPPPLGAPSSLGAPPPATPAPVGWSPAYPTAPGGYALSATAPSSHAAPPAPPHAPAALAFAPSAVAAPPALLATYDPLLRDANEAATHRGLVAARLEPRRTRAPLLAAGALALVAVGGVVAVAVLRPGGGAPLSDASAASEPSLPAAPAAGTAAGAAPTTEVTAPEATASAPSASASAPDGSTRSAAEAPAAPASSTSAAVAPARTTAARLPPPTGTPPPSPQTATGTQPTIRSPFE